MIAPIQSLAQLKSKARKDPKYRDLAVLTAQDLGGPSENNDLVVTVTLDEVLNWLSIVAGEDGEDSVVEDLNARRELVK